MVIGGNHKKRTFGITYFEFAFYFCFQKKKLFEIYFSCKKIFVFLQNFHLFLALILCNTIGYILKVNNIQKKKSNKYLIKYK